ncbi:hypothetical protein NUU61_007937 [Penicillium alfredii]|uniref:Uncharacterized protein n=1 Tax=Penicillium alfredii TaxID=1506179 RepID=A0A9W9ERP1_9EURO|nr:uncharacterized protein NUU61_007937 [Penicillium alfredii]KAJ5086630.1 hypothetical protein NUU61_007937 [Penicillium alfredii]
MQSSQSLFEADESVDAFNYDAFIDSNWNGVGEDSCLSVFTTEESRRIEWSLDRRSQPNYNQADYAQNILTSGVATGQLKENPGLDEANPADEALSNSTANSLSTPQSDGTSEALDSNLGTVSAALDLAASALSAAEAKFSGKAQQLCVPNSSCRPTEQAAKEARRERKLQLRKRQNSTMASQSPPEQPLPLPRQPVLLPQQPVPSPEQYMLAPEQPPLLPQQMLLPPQEPISMPPPAMDSQSFMAPQCANQFWSANMAALATMHSYAMTPQMFMASQPAMVSQYTMMPQFTGPFGPVSTPQLVPPQPVSPQPAAAQQNLSWADPTVPKDFVANPNNHARWEYDGTGKRNYLNAAKNKQQAVNN